MHDALDRMSRREDGDLTSHNRPPLSDAPHDQQAMIG
jgi:hypothetical protein